MKEPQEFKDLVTAACAVDGLPNLENRGALHQAIEAYARYKARQEKDGMLVSELMEQLRALPPDGRLCKRTYGARPGVDQDGYEPLRVLSTELAYADDNGLWKIEAGDDEEGHVEPVIVLE